MASRPTTATVPGVVPSASPGLPGRATSSQSTSRSVVALPSSAYVVTCGSQSSTSVPRTASRLRSSARSWLPARRPGRAKSRSGRPVRVTHRTVVPCWRAESSSPSMVRVSVSVGSSRAPTSTRRIRVPGEPSASWSPPTTTTVSPTSSSSGSTTSGRSIRADSSTLSPVTSARTRSAVRPVRSILARSRPSDLATSGSSTPASCTLVPVSDWVALVIPRALPGAGACFAAKPCSSTTPSRAKVRQAPPWSSSPPGQPPDQPQGVTSSSAPSTYHSSSCSQDAAGVRASPCQATGWGLDARSSLALVAARPPAGVRSSLALVAARPPVSLSRERPTSTPAPTSAVAVREVSRVRARMRLRRTTWTGGSGAWALLTRCAHG